MSTRTLTQRGDTLDAFISELEGDHRTSEMEAEYRPSRDLAMALVEIRMRLNVSQKEFATRLGVTPAYLSKLESGVANPSIRSLASLLRRAGISLRMRFEISAPSVWNEESTFDVSERYRRSDLDEGEMYHVLTAAHGVVNAIMKSRADDDPLEMSEVLAEIRDAYVQKRSKSR